MPEMPPHASAFPVIVDWPTQNGHDSDHPLAEGKVGMTGIVIDSIEDMQVLFKGTPPNNVSPSIAPSATGFILLAFYVVVAKRQGVDQDDLNGTIRIENDQQGAYIYPFEPSMWIIDMMSEWCSTALPNWNIILSSEPSKKEVPIFSIDDSARQLHAEKLESLRRRRNPARVDSILQDLNDKASARENIMPVVIEAAENLCTLGEIADTLREIFGEYRT